MQKGTAMKSILCLVAMFVVGLLTAGCSTTPDTAAEKTNLITDSSTALNQMMAEDPGLAGFTKHAVGYAIFPSVAKGGVGIGGAYGKGIAYANGQMIGFADLSQATIGFQLGGQTYSELIAFETQRALNEFTADNYTFDAQASAIAVKAGASTDAKYTNGVAVFTLPQSGLMFEAAVGGQRFTFKAIETQTSPTNPLGGTTLPTIPPN
jgi:lipid-binding SYLF domain-containing protein